jgi:hypothetical protein
LRLLRERLQPRCLPGRGKASRLQPLQQSVFVAHDAHRAGRQAFERIRADALADQAQGRQTDRGGHASHLTVAALADRQRQPRIGHALAEPHGWIARPQPGRRVDLRDFGRQGSAVVQRNTATQCVERVRIRPAFDLHEIRLRLLVARIGEPMREFAVVGQQQQSLTVVIETTGRIDIRHADEFGQRAPRRITAVGELAQHAVRLVEQDQHGKRRGRSRARQDAMATASRLKLLPRRHQHVTGAVFVAIGFSAACAAVPQTIVLNIPSAPGLKNLSVIRSDSPMARYFSLSLSPSASVGGNVHTPFS